MTAFRSPAPVVKLCAAFARPFDNAVATARTCYSARLVDELDVARDPARRDDLARSIYAAGHHTTLQHAHFQFALANVSRQLIWSLLHSHPFYNSEQVSQRYVEVRPDSVAVPPLDGEALAVYERCAARQMDDYHRLTSLCIPLVADAYYARFPARRGKTRYDRDVRRKAQEVGRYVLPVATFAHLYHTISGITLLRLWRACEQPDTPAEARLVIGRMVEEVLRHDPGYGAILEPPLGADETLEAAALALPAAAAPGHAAAFAREFDAELGGLTSRLVARKPDNEALVAQAVREVLAVPRAALADEEALALVLDPRRNRYHGEALNLATVSKLMRALAHAGYTFRKKLSHTADSQDQRHRMTPASRPILLAHLTDAPDVVVPALAATAPTARACFDDSMARTWEAITALRRAGVPAEHAAYLLPNAAAVRLTESADLPALLHKLRARLCYNAQEEIWRASLDEARQIAAVEPIIGAALQPPCTLRARMPTTPICPEGARYCGVPVWRLPQHARQI
ncbi:MAG TPA: FAD-dependent thymidylate synthase [Polyangia bacterium]